jgi:hypothetical protein
LRRVRTVINPLQKSPQLIDQPSVKEESEADGTFEIFSFERREAAGGLSRPRYLPARGGGLAQDYGSRPPARFFSFDRVDESA